MNEENLPNLPSRFLHNYPGGAGGRVKAYEVQVEEFRIIHGVGRQFARVLSKLERGAMFVMVFPDTEPSDVVFVSSGASVPMVFRQILLRGFAGMVEYMLVGV